MKKGIIFDLDQTLVDSSLAESYRGKNWSKVYSLIPSFTLYNGYDIVFEYIKTNNIKVAIVSSSVSNYVKKVLTHFNINYDVIVAYHDVVQRKPSPEGMIKALDSMNLASNEVISFGDRCIDISASNAANIHSVACLWGSAEKEDLMNSGATYIVNNVSEIISTLSINS